MKVTVICDRFISIYFDFNVTKIRHKAGYFQCMYRKQNGEKFRLTGFYIPLIDGTEFV
jgi:hypothetical protein